MKQRIILDSRPSQFAEVHEFLAGNRRICAKLRAEPIRRSPFKPNIWVCAPQPVLWDRFPAGHPGAGLRGILAPCDVEVLCFSLFLPQKTPGITKEASLCPPEMQTLTFGADPTCFPAPTRANKSQRSSKSQVKGKRDRALLAWLARMRLEAHASVSEK